MRLPSTRCESRSACITKKLRRGAVHHPATATDGGMNRRKQMLISSSPFAATDRASMLPGHVTRALPNTASIQLPLSPFPTFACLRQRAVTRTSTELGRAPIGSQHASGVPGNTHGSSMTGQTRHTRTSDQTAIYRPWNYRPIASTTVSYTSSPDCTSPHQTTDVSMSKLNKKRP